MRHPLKYSEGQILGSSTLRQFKLLTSISSALAFGTYSLAALPCFAEPPIVLSEAESLTAQISPEAPAVQSGSEAPQSQPTQGDPGGAAAPASENEAAPNKAEEIPTVQSNIVAPCPTAVPVAAADNPAQASPETVTPLTGPVIPYPTEETPERVTALTAPVVPVDQSALQASTSESAAQKAVNVPFAITRPVIIAVPSTPRSQTAQSQGLLPEPPPADRKSVQQVRPTLEPAPSSLAATGQTESAPQVRDLPAPETTSSASAQSIPQFSEAQTGADAKVASLCPPIQAQTSPSTDDGTSSQPPEAPAKKKEINRAIDHTRKSLRNVRPF